MFFFLFGGGTGIFLVGVFVHLFCSGVCFFPEKYLSVNLLLIFCVDIFGKKRCNSAELKRTDNWAQRALLTLFLDDGV